MNTIPIAAKRDFLERLASAAPMKAIAELVWNGLDAGSDRIEVSFDLNPIEGIEKIYVRDYGTGIEHDKVANLFGNLGESWKKNQPRAHNRSLHGKSGQGRFKAFALGKCVEWNTTFIKNGQGLKYQIIGHSDALDGLQFSDPVVVDEVPGTEVVVSGIDKSLGSLITLSAPDELAKLFSAYLSQYPDIRIEYDGTQIDPSRLQDFKKDIPLDGIDLGNNKKVSASVSIVEWNVPTKRALYLCDASGVSLSETEVGVQVRAPDFQFTAYVKCDHFRDLDKENLLIMEELHPDVNAILKSAKQAIRAHFRRRLAERQGHIVQRWKDEKIYPYEDKTRVDPVEEAERQVFDIIAANVETYLPSFDEADTKSRKFMFRLLAQAIQQNPESVQKIITEVLNLKKDAQDELAELLLKTPFSSIISSAKIVANRLDFLVGLENLLFDKKTKKKLLERDQLHKILENEAWIFHEEFSLAGTEERLEEVLKKHIGILGQREDGSTSVVVGDESTGRIDLMLSRAIKPRSGKYDYLIIELKRPSKKIDDDVISQVKKYAIAVANDERFHGIPATWTFIAVSNEMDSFAKKDSSQRDRPPGQVYAEDNITVWVKEWGEVINNARARLDFVNSYLSYEANRDSAKAYLQKAHAKFIPVEDSESRKNDDDDVNADEPMETEK